MIEKIKSSFFIRIIFTYLNDIIKLKFVKYNKRWQKILDIGLINYKFYKGKYIEYESNEIGKEYDYHEGEIKFRGVFLKGERNGKGTEYKHNAIVFKGEFLNGKRNGKGKEYDFNDNLIFEGENLKGKRWNGKGYYLKNNITFSLTEGKGIVKTFDLDDDYGLITYYGEYLNGERNGKGKLYD